MGWHTHILTPAAMWSQQLFALHWMKNLLISNIYVTEFHNIFAFQKLPVQLTYLLIRFNKTKFFPWNTTEMVEVILIEMV